ncbi:MAG: TlpA family protein disulfide reductase, partial [Opitutaceae bacterium]|nr:TlpA family protein disulfide reductase [Opitutaceae bacterium]
LRLIATLFTLTCLAAPLARAQNAAADLTALVSDIQAKLRAGQGSAETLAPELARFETLREKYRGQKTDDAARIVFMQATLFAQVLDDSAKAVALLKSIATDYPGTPTALNADRALRGIEAEAKSAGAKTGVIGKAAPELHFNWSSQPGLKTLSALKGKVVVIDFWATWCGPCLSSFPQVRQLVDHYKDADVIVLGVTSIQGRVSNLEAATINTQGDPDRERGLMPAFMKARNMTWPVVFSDEEVFNPSYGVRGIPHMAIIAPDGTVRYNGIHPATPHAEKVKKIDPLLREFGLKVPGDKR